MHAPIADYQPFAELARGAAVVYKAYDRANQRTVLLKVLTPEAAEDPALVAWFEGEARAVAAVVHPNVVALYDAGQADGQPYLAAEFIEGASLAEVLAGGPLPPELAAYVVAEAARGLGAAHAHGVLHRDVKPGNVILGTDGAVKLADFGLATRVETDDEGGAATAVGSVRGTPGYLAPEVVRGDRHGPAADLFALGAVLAETLTARPAFPADSVAAALDAALHHDAAPALRRDPRVPPALADVAACLLARDPAARPATADEAAALLDAHRTSPGAAAEVGATDLATYLENPAAYRAARPPALYSVETAEAASLPAEAAGDRPAAGRVHPLRKTRILFAAVGVLALASVAYAAWVRRPTPAATVRPESASAGGIVPPTRTAPALVADSVALTVPPVVPGPDSVARPLVPPGTEAVAPLPTPPDRVEPLRADPPATAADVPVAPPAAGALSVAVQPWAEVVVDGRSIGTTPLNGPISLPAGTHRVVLRNGAFPEYAETVTVAPGETARLAVSLWSTVGRVTLTVSPWARVEVDGRAVGTTPLREPLVLAPGTHTVRLTHPTLGVHEETVRVGAGEARDLRVRMGAGGGGAGAGSAADGGGGGGPLEQPLH